jgi:hypothetical protein
MFERMGCFLEKVLFKSGIYKFLIRNIFSPPIVKIVYKESLTYLSIEALNDLFSAVKSIEKGRLPGLIIEAGCALGGSAMVIAAAKSDSRLLKIYDVFGMIPPPSESDGSDVHKRFEIIKSGQSSGIAGNKYYGYEENILEKVTGNFHDHGLSVEEHNIQLIQGLFQDVLHIQEPVALAHIDGDWYKSVMTCLCRIEPYLMPGGVLVIDDYYEWSGCRKAVDEYFSNKMKCYSFIKKSRLHIVRK